MGGDHTASPSWRVWHTVELALSIVSELNQLDLLNLSLVSKHFRFLSLTRLLHKQLDIPLTRFADYIALINNNQTQAQLIRHIRIYDDTLPARLRHRPRTSSESPFQRWSLVYRPTGMNRAEVAPKDLDYAFTMLGLDRFLHVLNTRCASRPPSFDLTIGLSNAHRFAGIVRAHPILADRITALRVVVDHVDEPDRLPEQAQRAEFVKRAESHWASLVQMIDHVQSRPSASKIRTVHFVDPRMGRTGRWYASRSIWDSLGNALSSSVRALALRLNSDEDDAQWQCSLLSIDWPKLCSFSLAMRNDGITDFSSIQVRLHDFLARHAAQLEELRIDSAHFYYEQTLPITFPKLRNCEVDILDPEQLCAFVAAHKDTLVHVRFPQPLYTPPDSSRLEPDPINVPPELESVSVPAHLSSLRGPIGPVLSFAKHGPNIRHLYLDNNQVIVDVGQEFLLEAIRNSMPNQAASVTCIDVAFHCFPSDWLNEKLCRSLFASFFPCLVELRLAFDYTPTFGSVMPESSPWARAQEHVLAILKALQGSSQIVALRLDLHSLPPPLNAEITLRDKDALPPRLKYLTFHSTTPPEEHYFAVQHTFKLDLATNQEMKIATTLRGFRPIYRGRAARDDIWGPPPPFDPGSGTLFDHTQSPPALLIL